MVHFEPTIQPKVEKNSANFCHGQKNTINGNGPPRLFETKTSITDDQLPGVGALLKLNELRISAQSWFREYEV